MKSRRRRAVEVPQKIISIISIIKLAPLENIEESLKGFIWDFDKGDYHHWVDLFNHFALFFDKFIKPRKDLQFEDNFPEADSPFPKAAVLQILHVTRVILENCSNNHLYSSYEEHLSLLLASTDADVVEASLQTLAAFLKKPVGKYSIRDASLTSKLFAISQGWGNKEEGLGLIACSLDNGCDSVASEIGSTLHFEFYAVDSSEESSDEVKHVTQGLQVIHIPNASMSTEDDLVVLHQLVKEYNVPHRLRFSLLTRLRFARSFLPLTSRHQYICIRLYAFIILVKGSTDPDDMAAFFSNEPEFINELVSLLSYEYEVPEKIRILGILSLSAICQDRTRQPSLLTYVTSGGHRGILPSLMHKTVESITSGFTKYSVVFVEALFSLVSVLVSSTPGSLALQEAGYIPTTLPLLKDTNPQHIRLVSTAVLIIEGFLDFSNPAAALFRDLGGLDDTIARLMMEVSFVETGIHNSASQLHSKGKQVIDTSCVYSENQIAYHRRLLMKALLRVISLATYVPGSSPRIDGSDNSALPLCLCTIFKRANDFGGGVFSLAAIVMSDLLHKDPTCFPVLDAAGLPRAFLNAIMSGVLCSSEAVTCIPQCLDALCLNNNGLQLVKDCNALRCFVKVFTSPLYIRALSGDTPGVLSSALDELMRHASSLRACGVEMLVEILSIILSIGSVPRADSSSRLVSSSNTIPMETGPEDTNYVSSVEGDLTEVTGSEPMIESGSDATSISNESFVIACISNVARLLENVLQNADTCRLFIEKKGLEAVLQLFTHQLVPTSVSIGQSISVAFKSFSPQHSASLARAVCSFIREHLRLVNELLEELKKEKLADIDCAKRTTLLKYLSSLESLLSLATFLLKGTTSMLSELGSTDAAILYEFGNAYKEILWQISLSTDSKLAEKQKTDEEAGDASVSNVVGRESDDDGNAAPLVSYMDPLSIRNSSASEWDMEHDFVTIVRNARSMHRPGRHGLFRLRGSRLSRQLDASHSDYEASASDLETSLLQDIKKKNPAIVVSELFLKLGSTFRSFFATLVKGLTSRRRIDSNSMSTASKNIVTALAKLFHNSLSFHGHSSEVEVKCRYLGKIVNDMATVIFDSRRRACNAALVNSFYVNGTFKELLTTFEATSQLLWTTPLSFPTHGQDQGGSAEGTRVSHNSWLLDTLQSYCLLLEYHVNSSLLLSPSSPSQAQSLVQPVATGLSLGLFGIPRDPDAFVQLLQSQVLDVILPIWNHSLFTECNSVYIASVLSLVNHIFSGVGDLKRSQAVVSGSTGHRVSAPALDESTIDTIVEMGFTRARAEEALRSVRTNSVEMATDWLFTHPEEVIQEDVQLAQALALSLGNSSEATKDDIGDESKNVFTEERRAETPPVDDILAVCTKLFRISDSVAFPLTDLLVTLCNRNKGEDRPKVVSHLIQQLKLRQSDFMKDTCALCSISHVLALVFSEDSSTREIAAKNGAVSVVLDVLFNCRASDLGNDALLLKSVSALFLILNIMLQSRPRAPTDTTEGISKSLSPSSGVDFTLANPSSNAGVKSEDCPPKEPCDVFEKILGKSTGYLTLEESRRAIEIACQFIKQQVPAVVMQAVLQLCARITKTHAVATWFLDSGGLADLFSLPTTCMFPGFDSLACVIVRHLLEDPQTLQTAMELEIKQAFAETQNRLTVLLSPRSFLTSMAPVISRDPEVFMKAAAAVCQLEHSAGRTSIVLLKEKEKDKDSNKLKSSGSESLGHPNDPVRISENKLTDTPLKCSKTYKKVPTSLYQVIDQLLEIVMSYPSAENNDKYTGSATPMEIDEPIAKEKGKFLVGELRKDSDNISERSAWLVKVTFVLKLMSDILLMYVHAVGVMLKRDSETCLLHRTGVEGAQGQGWLLRHLLHKLLPLYSEKTTETLNEWEGKLTERVSWFLVVLCGRSTEGRKRVIIEIVNAFSSLCDMDMNCSKRILLPNKMVLAFADLVNYLLSKNVSNAAGHGCSSDIAKTMIDGGMLHALSRILNVLDLDHPDAPKVVNPLLKALENLTRIANARDQMIKMDCMKKISSSHERIAEAAGYEDSAIHRQESTNTIQTENQHVYASVQNNSVQEANTNQPVQEDMPLNGEINTINPLVEGGRDFGHQEMSDDVLADRNEAGLTIQVEHRHNDDLGDEDEDIGEDDDEEDEDEEDDDIAEEEPAMMPIADTDMEDHDDNDMDDEYNDDDDFHENRVIGVRWREGLRSLDQVRFISGAGNENGVRVNITSEHFRGVNADDIFHRYRPSTVEGRRQTVNRTSLDRSVPDGSAFQHPLLLRPPPSTEPGSSLWSSSLWSSVGNSPGDMEALSFGGYETAYMFDAGISYDHSSATIIGDRFVGASPPTFMDFSLGMNSSHVNGRDQDDGRWTDDGQPQAGAYAATVAEAVEEHFVSQLRGTVSIDNPPSRGQDEQSAGQSNQQLPSVNPNNNSPVVANIPTGAGEDQHQEARGIPLHQTADVATVDVHCLPELSHEAALQSEFGAENSETPEARQLYPTDLGTEDGGGDHMQFQEGVGPTNISSVDVPTVTTYSNLQVAEQQMQDDYEMLQSDDNDFRSHSSNNALIDSGSTMPDSSDGHAGRAHSTAAFDMNDNDDPANQVESSLPPNDGELVTRAVPEANVNIEASSTNAIDPTFLEALPEDLRAEVLASQQAQSAQTSAHAPPPAEDIDPEFLAALPPDIQAEVLAQQRTQRNSQSQQSEGQPVDMDNASIIATFPPELREEVLLTSSEAVLSALPSALLAEAQMLRDRTASHYHARSSLFGGSHRLSGRRLAIDRQTVIDRGVGASVGQRSSAPTVNFKITESEGLPLLDLNSLRALIRLLRLAQPLSKGLLQRVLLNLCANSDTRAHLVSILVAMIKSEADGSCGSATRDSQRLYGCKWNVVYGRPQSQEGLPPLVSRRVLELLTYLATNHSYVASILFCTDSSVTSDSPTIINVDQEGVKGKGKLIEAKGSLAMETSSEYDMPIVLFLKLLNRPLFLRSSAHLEQVMGLLQQVVNNAVAVVDSKLKSRHSAETRVTNIAPSDEQRDPSSLGQNQEITLSSDTELPLLPGDKSMKIIDILLRLPKTDLQNVCNILANEGLSDKVYTLASEVMKKLASVAALHRKFFVSELAGLAHKLSVSAVGELVTLRETDMLGLSAASMAGAATLRVLQTLGTLTLVGENKGEEAADESEERSILLSLNAALEPMWQELSDCITTTEEKLAQNSFSSPVSTSETDELIGSGSSLSPLPPGTQRLLPFVEAFFVLCEKLQTYQSIVPVDHNVTAREVKEFGGSSLSPSLKGGGSGSSIFGRIAEKHRRLLNLFIRQNPSLLEKSLSMMLKVPRLIDFDNKRAYFRSRIRHHHDQHHSSPLRISVRRAYVLEDSYNQLRMRPTQDLKGRLTVQFQGEEGIDAGGLTREWYQLLSRVIFDKGALLFTNVGNNATFQPNPNSVYQTEHLSYFKFVGRVVAKALFDGQLLDVYFTRSFYKHILGVKVTYHDIEPVDPDYYKNLKWMLENDVTDIPDLTFSMDADEEKHILYEKTEVMDFELKPGGRNIRVTEETKHEYVDLVAEHILTTAIRPQINSFLEGFSELVPRELISIFNDKELELLISGLPEIDLDDLKANTEYTGYTAASTVINWFWDVVTAFNKEDMARFLQFVTGTSKVPLEGFKALQGISGSQRFQIHKAYGAPERLPSAHTCFNQLDLPEYASKEQLQERLLLAIHEASEGFGFG